MSEFVERCRREWTRLRVPDPIANEMAEDLAADLSEAEVEGASPEDLLGDAALDPQAFARSWAEERGLVLAPSSRWNSRLALALAVAAIVIGGSITGALLLTQTSAQRQVPVVTVKDFVGMNVAKAMREAMSNGVSLGIRYRTIPGGRSHFVRAQFPRAGAQVRQGAPVQLVVNR